MAIEQKRIEEMCAYLIDHLKVTDLGILMTWQDWQINFPATAEVVRHIATGAVSAGFPELASDPPAGWVAPWEATEAMWGGLARQIVMWGRFGGAGSTGIALHMNLKHSGYEIPAWLIELIPPIAHTPPKGAVAGAIYRAMRDAHTKEQT